MSFMQEAVREWAWSVGRENTTRQWILSNYDTWEPNPHYVGPDQGHPDSGEGPACTVYLTYKEAAEEAVRSAAYLGYTVRVERYRDRWVVWY